MPSVEYLRAFINERLSAAAEEIFGAFKRVIVEYEDEIVDQRRLLESVRKPDKKPQWTATEPPQLPVFKEEEALPDQRLCHQERNSSMDQEDPEPPQMKEEQEELCISQEGEQLVLKRETDTFMLTATNEENDHSEDQTLFLNPVETLSAAQKESVVNTLVITSTVGESNSDLQLFSNSSHETENQDQKRDTCAKDLKFKQNSHSKMNTGEKTHVCHICEKDFTCRAHLTAHMRIHTAENPYICQTCGKHFTRNDHLKIHMRVHTSEKPYVCKICEKAFSQNSTLKIHTRVHTAEKPYVCKICEKAFSQNITLKVHMRIHTGEKLYVCKTCGKAFRHNSRLTTHMRVHT